MLPVRLHQLEFVLLAIIAQLVLLQPIKLRVWQVLIALSIREQYRVIVAHVLLVVIVRCHPTRPFYVREDIIAHNQLESLAHVHPEPMATLQAWPHLVNVLLAMLATTVTHSQCRLQKECAWLVIFV